MFPVQDPNKMRLNLGTLLPTTIGTIFSDQSQQMKLQHHFLYPLPWNWKRNWVLDSVKVYCTGAVRPKRPWIKSLPRDYGGKI